MLTMFVVDRGDGIAIADVCWSSVWTAWSLEERENYIASAATWGPLSCDQACELLQGHPPMPKGWEQPDTCIAEFIPLQQRLKSDIARGALHPQPTAEELAAWCAAMGASLPQSLEDALEVKASAPMPPSQASQASTTYIPPAWAPVPAVTAATLPKPQRGRPKVAAQVYATIEKVGQQFLMGEARQGRDVTLEQIAKHIHAMGHAPGMQVTTIKARLKSKLTMEKSKHTAAAARARANQNNR
jgi:hypothetical protein